MGEELSLSVNSTKGWTDEQLAELSLFGGYPTELLQFASICCVIFMIVGIPGNLITIWCLARYRKVRNATAIFIINLSVADFLFCCINLPLAASTFWTQRWYFGVSMCTFFPFARFLLAGVSTFTIVNITLNRYILITHPKLYTRLYTSRNLGIIIAATWILMMVGLAPILAEVWGRFGMDLKDSFCIVLPDHHGRNPKTTFFTGAFVIQLITICICYARIFYVVRKTNVKLRATIRRDRKIPDKEDTSFATSSDEKSPDSETASAVLQVSTIEHPRVQSLRPPSTPRVSLPQESEKNRPRTTSAVRFKKALNIRKSQIIKFALPTSKDKRLLTMISAIIVAFFISHLPITIIKVFSNITSPPPSAMVWSYLLRYLTNCINPIIYVVMSSEYRKVYKKALVNPLCTKKMSLPR